MGILQLSQKHSESQLEAACKYARGIGSYTYTTVSTILKNSTEKTLQQAERKTPEHENIRGGGYYN
jgi:hypothetical protein